MSDSILLTIREFCTGQKEDDYFDNILILHANSVFSILNHLGIGPKKPFSISDDSSEWEDFTNEKTYLESVKSYVCLKVKLLFDPPASSTILDSYTRQISEIEWRLFEVEDE